MSLSISDFIRKSERGEPITPPTRVNGFQPGDLPGSFKTYEGGYYAVDDSKYGAIGSIHLRPKTLGASPWSTIGSGVFLENYQALNRYKVDIVISSGASGHCVLRGEFVGERVVRDHKGNRTFGETVYVDVSMEFLVGGVSGSGEPTIYVTAPYGVYQRPVSGSFDIGPIAITGGTGKSVKWTGAALPLKKTGVGWMVYCTSTTPLGRYWIESVTVTAGGKDYVVAQSSVIELIKGTSIPEPPLPPPEPEPVPVPVIVDVWGAKKSTTETVALGDEDGVVQWASTTTVEADGESRTEAEILPGRALTGYLPVPKTFRPIRNHQIKRSVEMADEASVGKFGRREKRIKFTGVDSWGALQQFGEYSLREAARCVEGTIVVSGNPFIRSGDTVSYDGHEWLVERATHNLGDWTTTLTARRILTGFEVGGIFVRASESVEKTIVRIIKDATGRVNNAVEGVIVRRIDSQRYLVRVVGREEEIEVVADYSIFGDLLVGSSVLIGRGTL